MNENEIEPTRKLNLSSTYFKLDTDSYFWWIHIEGVGYIYVGFAILLLIAEFTVFPYILYTSNRNTHEYVEFIFVHKYWVFDHQSKFLNQKELNLWVKMFKPFLSKFLKYWSFLKKLKKRVLCIPLVTKLLQVFRRYFQIEPIFMSLVWTWHQNST